MTTVEKQASGGSGAPPQVRARTKFIDALRAEAGKLRLTKEKNDILRVAIRKEYDDYTPGERKVSDKSTGHIYTSWALIGVLAIKSGLELKAFELPPAEDRGRRIACTSWIDGLCADDAKTFSVLREGGPTPIISQEERGQIKETLIRTYGRECIQAVEAALDIYEKVAPNVMPASIPPSKEQMADAKPHPTDGGAAAPAREEGDTTADRGKKTSEPPPKSKVPLFRRSDGGTPAPPPAPPPQERQREPPQATRPITRPITAEEETEIIHFSAALIREGVALTPTTPPPATDAEKIACMQASRALGDIIAIRAGRLNIIEDVPITPETYGGYANVWWTFSDRMIPAHYRCFVKPPRVLPNQTPPQREVELLRKRGYTPENIQRAADAWNRAVDETAAHMRGRYERAESGGEKKGGRADADGREERRVEEKAAGEEREAPGERETGAGGGEEKGKKAPAPPKLTKREKSKIIAFAGLLGEESWKLLPAQPPRPDDDKLACIRASNALIIIAETTCGVDWRGILGGAPHPGQYLDHQRFWGRFEDYVRRNPGSFTSFISPQRIPLADTTNPVTRELDAATDVGYTTTRDRVAAINAWDRAVDRLAKGETPARQEGAVKRWFKRTFLPLGDEETPPQERGGGSRRREAAREREEEAPRERETGAGGGGFDRLAAEETGRRFRPGKALAALAGVGALIALTLFGVNAIKHTRLERAEGEEAAARRRVVAEAPAEAPRPAPPPEAEATRPAPPLELEAPAALKALEETVEELKKSVLGAEARPPAAVEGPPDEKPAQKALRLLNAGDYDGLAQQLDRMAYGMRTALGGDAAKPFNDAADAAEGAANAKELSHESPYDKTLEKQAQETAEQAKQKTKKALGIEDTTGTTGGHPNLNLERGAEGWTIEGGAFLPTPDHFRLGREIDKKFFADKKFRDIPIWHSFGKTKRFETAGTLTSDPFTLTGGHLRVWLTSNSLPGERNSCSLRIQTQEGGEWKTKKTMTGRNDDLWHEESLDVGDLRGQTIRIVVVDNGPGVIGVGPMSITE